MKEIVFDQKSMHFLSLAEDTLKDVFGMWVYLRILVSIPGEKHIGPKVKAQLQKAQRVCNLIGAIPYSL